MALDRCVELSNHPKMGLLIRSLLSDLLGDDRFAYSFSAPYPNPTVGGQSVHGPFIISELHAASFIPVSHAQVMAAIEAFLVSSHTPQSLESLGLKRILSWPISQSAITYRPLPSHTTSHARSAFLGDCMDFVLIDREVELLQEIVMGTD
jgi:hypothetical protein